MIADDRNSSAAPEPSAPPHRAWLHDSLILLAVALAGILFAQPGVFTVDESHYLLTANSLAQGDGFSIENGYSATADPALLYFYTAVPARVAELGSVSSVPPFQAILGLPWMWALGSTGLIALNLLAFGLCLVATRRLAFILTGSPGWALCATGLVALSAFSLEYAFGIWPHALSQALVAWSLLALIKSRTADRVWLCCLGAGLLLGLANGVRLQNVVLLPLLLTAAFLLQLGWRRAILIGLAWLAPMIIYAGINQARLDTLNPFTYGAQPLGALGGITGLLASQPWLALAPFFALGGAWWLWRKTGRALVWWGLGLAGLATALALDPTRAWLARWLQMASYHLVDTSLAESQGSAGAHFNELGQVLYGGVLKKSLLQAAPWVIVALLGLLPLRFRKPMPSPVQTLTMVALGGLALLPFVVSPGGFCFNPRYLLELMPALAVLAVYWAQTLSPPRPALLLGILGGLAAAAPLLLNPGRVDAPAGGLLVMLIPLALSAAVLVLASAALVGANKGSHLRKLAAAFALSAAFTYAGLIHLRVDLSRSLFIRTIAAKMAAEAEAALPAAPHPSVILTWEGRKDVLTPVKLSRDVWIGVLGRHEDRAPRLLQTHLGARRLFVLKNGIPPDRFQAWFGLYGQSVQVRKGLEFVELLPREAF